MNHIYLNIKEAEESRIIVVRNNRLNHYEHEMTGAATGRGNIYKGVVVNIEPSLEAVFLDIGENKNAMLPLREIPPNAIGVSEGGVAVGDELLVQIKKDNVGSKGAGLTGYISLAGNFLVLLPYKGDASGVSAKADPGKRRELSKIIDTLPLPENMSVIVRSQAIDFGREDIQWDLESYLLRLWEAVLSATRRMKGPVLIYRENDLLLRVMRDHFRPDKGDIILCDQKDRYDELCTFVNMLFPENTDQIKFYDGKDNMVPLEVERQIEQIYMREVSAASGVRIVFDSTEALVAVDVNSGRQREGGDIEETALKTNLEAAEIITEQLRLRNLSGLVVIDFIDMRKAENCAMLEERVNRLLKNDRARTRCSKISEFGLMEISRQRTLRSLLSSFTESCPCCEGSGQVWRKQSFAMHLLRKIRYAAAVESTRSLILQVPHDTAVFLLNEKRSDIQEIEQFSACNVIIVPDNRMLLPQYKLKPVKRDLDQVMEVARQMQKQEEAAQAQYTPSPVVKENRAVLRNMLPSERIPSQEASSNRQEGLIVRLVKKLFGSDASDPAIRTGNSAARRQDSKPRQQRERTERQRRTRQRTGNNSGPNRAAGRTNSGHNGNGGRTGRQNTQQKRTVGGRKPAAPSSAAQDSAKDMSQGASKGASHSPVERRPSAAPAAPSGTGKTAVTAPSDSLPQAAEKRAAGEKPSAPPPAAQDSAKDMNQGASKGTPHSPANRRSSVSSDAPSLGAPSQTEKTGADSKSVTLAAKPSSSQPATPAAPAAATKPAQPSASETVLAAQMSSAQLPAGAPSASAPSGEKKAQPAAAKSNSAMSQPIVLPPIKRTAPSESAEKESAANAIPEKAAAVTEGTAKPEKTSSDWIVPASNAAAAKEPPSPRRDS